MPPAPTNSFVVDALDPDDIASTLGLEPVRVASVRRQWFDTFEDDLWRSGLVLEADDEAGAATAVVLRDRDDHRVEWTQTVDVVPRGVDQLPAGPWRRSLAGVLGLRALIPVAQASVGLHVFARTDEREKRVAMVEVLRPHTDGDALGSTSIRVVSVRGYEDAGSALAREVSRIDGVDRTHRHPAAVVSGAASSGDSLAVADPGPSSSSPTSLDPDQTAASAFAAMLSASAFEMRRIEPWLVDPPDTEFLHDYRVALRRGRAVVKMARGVVADHDLTGWRSRLRDLQQRTGPTRDLDVFVLEFESYRELVPPGFAADLDPFLELLRDRRRDAHRSLVRRLRSSAHATLADDLDRFIASLANAPRDVTAPDAGRPIIEVGVDRIRRAHRKVRTRGRRIGPQSPPDDLHQVRIAAKELRYAVELHQSLLPTAPTAALVRSLKSLQNLLGDFQDAESHAEAMERFAADMVSQGDAPARCVMALGLLANGFHERNDDIRERFADTFAVFDSAKTEALVGAALGPGGRS